MKKIKIVALPCVCADVFVGTDIIRPGGEELNFSAHAAEFKDVQVILLGAIGDDEYGKCIIRSIENRDIDYSHLRVENDLPTAHCLTFLTPEGDRYYTSESWNGDIVDRFRVNEAEIPLLADADVVFTHIRSKEFAKEFDQIIELKKKMDFKLAVDFEICRDFEKLETYAPYVDYFMISGEEALLPYFEAFSKKYDGLFNMTLAEKGSVTYYKGKCFRVSAVSVDEVVDTTGCGDSYHAGFVCEHMLTGDIERAMKKGSEIASKTLSHFGGF